MLEQGGLAHTSAQIFPGNLCAVGKDQGFAACPLFDQICFHFRIIFQVTLRAPLRDFVEWRLGNIEIPSLNDLRHLAIEEGQQKRPDVRAIDIGIGHDDDLVIAQLFNIELVAANASTKRHNQRADLIG